MNRAEFDAWFHDTAKPWLFRATDKADQFHQAATDAMGNRAVFWCALAFAVIGVVAVIRWVL